MLQDLINQWPFAFGGVKKYSDPNFLDSVALCGVSIISHECS